MTYILTLHEDLDAIVAGLSKDLARPCYVVTAEYAGVVADGTYRLPGKTKYVPLTLLEGYLGRWWGFGTCVERTANERRFHLKSADYLRVAYPLRPGEKKDPYSWEEFRKYSLEGRSAIKYVQQDSWLPPELESFVGEYRLGRHLHKGIRFVESEILQAPSERREGWHFGVKVKEFTTLQPPGQYCGPPESSVEQYNRLTICDCDPGPCVICHGAKGQRRHFGVVALGPQPYMANHICRGCAEEAFEQILRLLDTNSL